MFLVIRCNVLQIPNGRASISGLSIAVTEEVSYTCDTNYEIRGPNRVTCQRNKQLTQLPSCQGMWKIECLFILLVLQKSLWLFKTVYFL